MFLTAQISAKQAAQLCRRLAIMLEAGLDVRSIWQKEAQRASGFVARNCFQTIHEAVARGDALRAALDAAGSYFPPLFREIVGVGEQTGRLGEAFRELADHYDSQVRTARIFWAAIAWPAIELALSIAIIGALIWIQGMLPTYDGKPFDILGWGLVGNRGLVVYLLIVAVAAALVALVVRGMKRGLAWARPVQRVVFAIPVISKPLRTLALARLAWCMHLTLATGMEVRRALRLSQESSGSARFTDQLPPILDAIASGDTLLEAFEATRAFPEEFVQAVRVGEESGSLPETMKHLGGQYRQQAEAATAVLATCGGFAVWGLIALAIIAVIFRLAGFYVGTIYDALPR
jgi:type II secretory pathway component PulF